MNKYILLVMKWLNDNDSVTQKELNDNRNAAAAAAAADADAADAAYVAAYYADAAYVAAYYAAAADAAAYYAADADAADAAYVAAYYADDAEKWVNKYFEHTKENKQEYIDALSAGDKPAYTKEMVDAGVMPLVGMEYLDCDGQISECLVICDLVAIGKVKEHALMGEYLLLSQSIISEIKPLTPPIELEHRARYEFDILDAKLFGFYKESTGNFYLNGNVWHSSKATNIIKLIPEVKS